MKKFFSLILALCIVLGCSAALAEDEPLTIAISMRSTASEYHMQYVAGCRKAPRLSRHSLVKATMTSR